MQNKILRGKARRAVDQKALRDLQRLEQINRIHFQHVQTQFLAPLGDQQELQRGQALPNDGLKSAGQQNSMTFGMDRYSNSQHETADLLLSKDINTPGAPFEPPRHQPGPYLDKQELQQSTLRKISTGRNVTEKKLI